MRPNSRWAIMLFGLSSATLPSSATAELVLSQVIVDIQADEPAREDIELYNSGDERIYVAADPFLIENPGSESQTRIPATNPQDSGILVTPQKLVLEPGERRLVRVAAIAPRPSEDRIYRISIRPVIGEVAADADALKVLIGYDALVLVRPSVVTGDLEAEKTGQTLTFFNASNTSHELFEGRQCDASGENCVTLPGRRLYPGIRWDQQLPYSTTVTYKDAVGERVSGLAI
jgi:Mat/Ecp fimbriae periplasmic chaperone